MNNFFHFVTVTCSGPVLCSTNLKAGVLPAVAESHVQVNVALGSTLKEMVFMSLCCHSSLVEAHISRHSTARLIQTGC